MTAVLAIDVGGTKLAAGIVDGTGRLLAAERVPTRAEADPEQLWAALLDAVGAVLAHYAGPPITGVGVACGGPMRWPAGVVSPVNIPAWRDFPLRERLAAEFPGRPVRLHNDAVCVAVAEHWSGAGSGATDVLGMVVSTGVGGGLVLGDRLVDGATGNAGHIGHLIVEPGGPPCGCGARGCLEAVARGPAVVAWARDQGYGGEPTGVALSAAAAAGDPVAVAALARAGRALGIGIAGAVALTDVAVVALGGGLAQAGESLWVPLHASYAEHAALSFSAAVPVRPAAHGPQAGLVGAAALVAAGQRYWHAD